VFGLNTGTRLERSELDHSFVPSVTGHPKAPAKHLARDRPESHFRKPLEAEINLPVQNAMLRFALARKPTLVDGRPAP
jgi:hypothetical protein